MSGLNGDLCYSDFYVDINISAENGINDQKRKIEKI